jgi:hypothetical protein
MIDGVWEIVPGVGVGVGPARFGMAQSALRAQFGPYRAFRRANYSLDLTDQYGPDGMLMLTCGPVEGLYQVEIAEPSTVSYRGVSLAGTVAEVIAELQAAGAEPVEDNESGWAFADGTVRIDAPSHEPEADIEGVAVLAPGHISGEIVWIEGGATGKTVRSHTITPGQGIGLVTLGESRAAVRQRLHECMTTVERPDFTEPLQDIFWDDGLVLEYSADERVERIYVTKADSVEYAGIQVMPAPFDKIRRRLIDAGHAVSDRELALEIDGSGVQLWLSNTQTEHRLPVSTVVLSAG